MVDSIVNEVSKLTYHWEDSILHERSSMESHRWESRGAALRVSQAHDVIYLPKKIDTY